MPPVVACPVPGVLEAESRLLRALADQHPEWTDEAGACPPCAEAALRWALDEFPDHASPHNAPHN